MLASALNKAQQCLMTRVWPTLDGNCQKSNQSLFSSTRLLHLFENNLHEWIRVYYNILIEDFVGIYFYIQQNVYALCVE